MVNAYSIKSLLQNAKTVTPTAGAELVAISKGSFDKLAFEIVEKQNRVVSVEAEFIRFETAVEKERTELSEELAKAQADAAAARKQWEDMVAARGIRGLLPVAVERTQCPEDLE